eukprot:scaffold256965_cov19-Tisochrysis_lutea.AAC.2
MQKSFPSGSGARAPAGKYLKGGNPGLSSPFLYAVSVQSPDTGDASLSGLTILVYSHPGMYLAGGDPG